MPPPADGLRGATRSIPTLLIALAVLFLAARITVGLIERGRSHSAPMTQGKIQWQTIEAGEALARRTGQPILYDFTAEWCGPCKQLEREVFAEDGAAMMISSNFVPIRVLDRQREEGQNTPAVTRLQTRYQVRAFPTLVVVRGDSSVATRMEGYAGKQQVMSQLMQATLPFAR